MRFKKIFYLTFIILILLLSVFATNLNEKPVKETNDHLQEFENCTSIVITKSASVDGSVMTTHSCDGDYEFRLKVIPGKII